MQIKFRKDGGRFGCSTLLKSTTKSVIKLRNWEWLDGYGISVEASICIWKSDVL